MLSPLKLLIALLFLVPLSAQFNPKVMLRITSPVNGTLVAPGQTLQIKITAPAGVRDLTLFGPNSIGAVGPFSGPPFLVSVEIPRDAEPGLHSIAAMAATPGGQSIISNIVSLDIERPDTPISISTVPTTLDMSVGEKFWLMVYGTYRDGRQVLLTKSASTRFTSQSPQIVTVTSAGEVTAISPGSTQILVDGTLPLPVVVEPPLTIFPVGASIPASQSQQFYAHASNHTVPRVNWSVSPSGAGFIDSAGRFTAPSVIPSDQTVTITATNVSDQTQTAGVIVHLVPTISLSISPSTVELSEGQTQQFFAKVDGSADTAVSWSLSPRNLGELSPTGVYTAPLSIALRQSVTITATSLADLKKSASATVVVRPRH